MIEQLRRFVETLPPGSVDRSSYDELRKLLAESWHAFSGDYGGMEGRKIPGRAYDLEWRPPTLTFSIERHGAIVAGGSGYAEIQTWTVNPGRATADLAAERKRRIRPMQPAVDCDALAEELVGLVLGCADDDRLQWTGDRRRVRIRTTDALPAAAKQTTEGRLKRLRKSLKEQLSPHGWRCGPGGWWGPTAEDAD